MFSKTAQPRGAVSLSRRHGRCRNPQQPSDRLAVCVSDLNPRSGRPFLAALVPGDIAPALRAPFFCLLAGDKSHLAVLLHAGRQLRGIGALYGREEHGCRENHCGTKSSVRSYPCGQNHRLLRSFRKLTQSVPKAPAVRRFPPNGLPDLQPVPPESSLVRSVHRSSTGRNSMSR